jgi:uncharacterized membrane protein
MTRLEALVFGSFRDLPIHALVVHASVILIPIAAVLAIALLRPAWRMVLRWPLVVAIGLSVVLAFVSRASGTVLKDNLEEQTKGTVVGKAIEHHQELADRLWIFLLVFFVVSVIAALLLPRLNNPIAGGIVAFIVAAIAVVVIVLVIQTGEAGTKAVWNPDGSIDYSGG